MTEGKRARVLSFPNNDNRLRSIAAEFLARSMISGLLHIPERDIIIDHHESGQPFVPGLPFHISLSHSGHLAMAAVSSHPVGADVEFIDSRGIRLLKRVCSAEEQTYILTSGSFDALRFYTVWTAKEAVLKHSGKGLSGGLAETIVAGRSGLLPEINGIPLVSGTCSGAVFSVYG